MPLIGIIVGMGLCCLCAPVGMMVGSTAVGALMESRPGAALVDASRDGDMAAAKQALADGADPNYRLIELEISPMQAALGNEKYEVALLLARHGAKVRSEVYSRQVNMPPKAVWEKLTAAEDEYAAGRRYSSR